MTSQEVAKYLRIPIRTLYKLCQEGKIPATIDNQEMHPYGDNPMNSAVGLDMVQRGFKALNFLLKKGIRNTSVGGQRGELYLQKSNEDLEKTTQKLKKSVKALKKANRKILEQQKLVIEEERLKVLLQMAGATAHEINQPLMALLGNIELMGMNKNRPKKLNNCMAQIEEAGQRIADIECSMSS
jgi:signal transduction histidine kinase